MRRAGPYALSSHGISARIPYSCRGLDLPIRPIGWPTIRFIMIPKLLLVWALVAPALGVSQSGLLTYSDSLLRPVSSTTLHYARQIAADGAWMVVSNTQDNTLSVGQGSVEVFRRGPSGYERFQTLVNPDPLPQIRFGQDSLDVRGNVLAISASGYPDASQPVGAAYLFAFDGVQWNFSQRLHFSNPTAQVGFGRTVCVADDQTVLVGAQGHAASDALTEWRGSVVVFRQSGPSWVESQVLRAPKPTAFVGTTLFGDLGYRLASDGEHLVAGLVGFTTGSHLLALFDRNSAGGWDLSEQVRVHNVELYEEARYSLALDGDRFVLGSEYPDGLFPGGRAVVYQRTASGWQEEAVLQPSDGSGLRPQRFGSGVDIEADRIVVGAKGFEEFGVDSGAGYLFTLQNGTWTESQRLRVEGSAQGVARKLGSDVALAPAAIGLADRKFFLDPLNQAGAAFVYFEPIGQTTCTGLPNSTGSAAELVCFGSPVAEHGHFFCRVSQLPSQRFGLLIAGTQAGFVSHPGGSQGHLCVGGALARFHHTLGQPDPWGSVELAIDMTSVPANPTQTILAGQTWHFQYWTSDGVAGQNTSNFSSAQSVTFE